MQFSDAMISKAEILRRAIHYFGKDRSHLKALVLSMEFDGKKYRKWKKDIASLVPHPNDIRFNLFEDVTVWINDNQADEIDWNWIGDLSWTITIVLNPGVDKVYDLDKRLAIRCKGTARLLAIFVSDAIPCYTYDAYYMTYDNPKNYYEFGPITALNGEEQHVLGQVTQYLEGLGMVYVDEAFVGKRHRELYSDTNSSGNASLFDVLFTDTQFYRAETVRFSDKEIIEKVGTKLRWREVYDDQGGLKERTESRWTKGGDYFKIVMDARGQILQVGVTRKEIEDKKFQQFEFDIAQVFKRRNAAARRKNGIE